VDVLDLERFGMVGAAARFGIMLAAGSVLGDRTAISESACSREKER